MFEGDIIKKNLHFPKIFTGHIVIILKLRLNRRSKSRKLRPEEIES
jgi:hypothetical protein